LFTLLVTAAEPEDNDSSTELMARHSLFKKYLQSHTQFHQHPYLKGFHLQKYFWQTFTGFEAA